MNIAVYCGSSDGNNPNFLKSARIVGEWIGKNGHTLVYGGAQGGLMGVVAQSALDNGGKVVGVIPDIEHIKARKMPNLTEYIYTKDLAERKAVMINLSDAFIALPGGPGTLDEISDIFSLNRVGTINSPAILFDTDGYYQPLWSMLKLMQDSGFTRDGDYSKLLVSENITEIGRFIEESK